MASNISAASLRIMFAASGFEWRMQSAVVLRPEALDRLSQYLSPALSKHIVAIS